MRALKKYKEMRDFTQTPEPSGDYPGSLPGRGEASSRGAQTALSYVIQKHDASHLHYDFRLELDGVLLSWAIPKGPSLDPKVKRLAVETEPHPLEYAAFEGVIAEGQYGGGTVMVWDRGSWTPVGDPHSGYRRGRLNFVLDGEKLHGAWHLVRTQRPSSNTGSKSRKNWLLFKSGDSHADADGDQLVLGQTKSVLTGRTLEEIAAARTEEQSKPRKSKRVSRSDLPNTANSKRKTTAFRSHEDNPGSSQQPKREPGRLRGAVRAALSESPSPQLATLVSSAPGGDDWIHELKFDGYRIMVTIETKGRGASKQVRLLTRSNQDWTDRIPSLARAVEQLSRTRSIRSVVLDGELVALNPKGMSDFQTLQNTLGTESDSLVYYAFDVLYLDSIDLRAVSLLERKALLQELVSNADEAPEGTPGTASIRVSEHVVGGGPEFFQRACELGLEGIVSKRASSRYTAGRNRDWLKTKCQARQEFVVVGYTDPNGTRSHLGALLLGLRRGEQLVYSGRVGTGFSGESLAELHRRLVRLQAENPAVQNAPRGADARGVHWVKPQLVAEIAFTGFTSDGLLRHPTFRGLREDKNAREAVEEVPVATEDNPGSTLKRGKVAGAMRIWGAGSDYPLTHPDKILYPGAGITKRELLGYYELVADRMLPHVGNRPLTLVRCPDGHNKSCFFQKHPGKSIPTGIRTITIREQEGKAPYAVIDDAQGLFALVQMGALEIHTWGSRADDFEHPDLLVFDLDPDPTLDFSAVVQCARRLRRLFDEAKLESFVKTTGGKGLHVCLPIEPKLTWAPIKAFANSIAEALAQESPQKYVSTQSKAKRSGKIFIDYLRNGRGATFVAPYSTRARENCPVAVPLEWDELTPSFTPGQFTLRNLTSRLTKQRIDPFERMVTIRQRLPTV